MMQLVFYVLGMISGGFIISQTYDQLYIFVPLVMLISAFSFSTVMNALINKRTQYKFRLYNQERNTLLKIRHNAKLGAHITTEMLTNSLRASRQIQKELD